MFETLQRLPADPILKLIVDFAKDTNPYKVDLGVGIYKEESGQTPVLASVKAAEARVIAAQQTKAYIGPAGNPDTNEAVETLLLGNHPVIRDGRVVTFQTPGGSGALRVGAELINRSKAHTNVWVSIPSWGNHLPMMANAGLGLKEYPYYNFDTKRIDFDAMMSCLQQIPAGEVVLLHACCHNPCGADLTHEQWQDVCSIMTERGLIPFIDLAYQGLSEGLEQDAYGPRLLAESVPEMLLAASCSKNFGLYRERTGSISIISAQAGQTPTAASQLASITRGLYSMPPSHGSSIVATILKDAELKQRWETELAEMRNRLNTIRCTLVDKLAARGVSRDFSFIAEQRGMFSFLGLTAEQVNLLANQYSIYMVDSSRICIAGVNQQNIDYICDSLAAVLG